MVTHLLGKALIVFVSLSFLCSTSCSTFQVINSDKDALQNKLKKGDDVRITTKERGTFTLKILEISSEVIVGEGRVKKYIPDRYPTKQQILFNEITEIKRKQSHTGYTIIGILFLPTVFLVAILVSPGSIGSLGYNKI